MYRQGNRTVIEPNDGRVPKKQPDQELTSLAGQVERLVRTLESELHYSQGQGTKHRELKRAIRDLNKAKGRIEAASRE